MSPDGTGVGVAVGGRGGAATTGTELVSPLVCPVTPEIQQVCEELTWINHQVLLLFRPMIGKIVPTGYDVMTLYEVLGPKRQFAAVSTVKVGPLEFAGDDPETGNGVLVAVAEIAPISGRN